VESFKNQKTIFYFEYFGKDWDLSKISMLRQLGSVFLESLVKSKGISDKDNVLEVLAGIMTEDEIEEYLEECIDAGRVTLFSYKLQNIPRNLKQYLESIIVEKRLTSFYNVRKIKASDISFEPKIHKIKLTDRYLKAFFLWKEKDAAFISELEDGYLGKCWYPRYNEGICKIHFNIDQMEVRTREDSIVRELVNQIRNIFTLQSEKISFERKLENFINFADGVSHTDVKPQSEIISTIGLTATQQAKNTKELLEDEDYKRLYKGGRLVGININKFIDDPYQPDSTTRISFRVNVKGKIFFYNNVREKEIEYVLKEASRIIDST